ncbi:MAG: hypothetical protein ACE5FQ_10625, partial [Thiogranum sp.]
IDFISIGLAALLVISLNSSVRLGVLLHQIMFILFVMVGQMSYRISSGTQYDITLYIVTCLVCVAYLFMLSMLSLLAYKRRRCNAGLVDACRQLGDKAWTLPIAIWFLFQVLLIYKYGISSLYLFRYADPNQSGLTYLNQSVLTLTTLLGYGAIVVFVVKSVTVKQFVSNKANIAIALAFIVPNFILGGSGMGARRFMLSLLLLAALLIIRKSSAFLILHKQFLKVILLVVLSFIGSWYFQNIRNNSGSFEVAQLISSDSVIEQLQGVGKFLIPAESPEVEADYFRKTPFGLLYDAMSRLVENNLTASGRVVWNSIQVVMPRIIFKSKPDEMTDELIASELRIPFDPLADDLSSSVLAIGIVDFGWIGIPMAAIISYISISLLEWLVVRQGYRILSIPFLGAWFSIVFGVETSLVQVLATIRDAVTAFMVLWIIGMFLRYRWVVPR